MSTSLAIAFGLVAAAALGLERPSGLELKIATSAKIVRVVGLRERARDALPGLGKDKQLERILALIRKTAKCRLESNEVELEIS